MKMRFSEKTNILQEKILKELSRLITSDYWLLELPYYTNIGDILIWEGTEEFLQKTGYRCLYKSSFSTFRHKDIAADTVILLQGGGNFGDLWQEPQEFRRKIIARYPDNKIIILPQTVYYANNDILLSDVELFGKHRRLTICARDNYSHETLKKYFIENNIVLLSDMAFCISTSKLKRYEVKQQNKTLFLKRTDKELNDEINYLDYIAEKEFDVHDWPSMEKSKISSFLLYRLLGLSRRMSLVFPKITDIYASLIFKPSMIKTGVKFLSKYNKVYTTRLHAAILCCLLEKPCAFFNNSYGKNRSFFETWFGDLEGMTFLPPPCRIISGPDFKDKTRQLARLIIEILAPLVDNDCVLMDLPYHSNIGDTLIWEGELQFIKKIKRKILFFCNSRTYRYRKINQNTIILLHGGGNFGDIWHDAHTFKEKIITAYPNNKIIMFPQTVCYTNESFMIKDSEIYAQHTNLTLCARDKKSYKILRKYFHANTVLLVPDMAFCIPAS